MDKRICIHCGGEITTDRGPRTKYCGRKCVSAAKRKREKDSAYVPKQRPTKTIQMIEGADRLFTRCFDAFGESDPWLERRDYGQYNYNADFVLGF